MTGAGRSQQWHRTVDTTSLCLTSLTGIPIVELCIICGDQYSVQELIAQEMEEMGAQVEPELERKVLLPWAKGALTVIRKP